MIVLTLLLGCTPPESSVPENTDSIAVVDTDLTVDTDPGDSDPDVGEVLQPAPGVFIDRASPTWFAVASQTLVCWLLIDPGSATAAIDLLGMDDGTIHPYISGLRIPHDAREALYDANLDLADGVLYLGRYRKVTAFEVEDGRWWPTKPIDGDQFASFGTQYSDGNSTWESWDAVGGVPDGVLGGGFGWKVASDGDALYVLDGNALRRVRGTDSLPARFQLARKLAQNYIAADVVGLYSIVMWQQEQTWWITQSDGNGVILVEHELPATYARVARGVACQAGPL